MLKTEFLFGFSSFDSLISGFCNFYGTKFRLTERIVPITYGKKLISFTEFSSTFHMEGIILTSHQESQTFLLNLQKRTRPKKALIVSSGLLSALPSGVTHASIFL